MNIDTIWEIFLKNINNQITSLAYETWFTDTKLVSLDNKKAIIKVPMHIHKKHLTENYYNLIESVLNVVTGTNFEIEFSLEEELNNKDGEIIDIDVDLIGVPTNKYKVENNLNPNYLFENFIVGQTNRLAHAAALAVSENPGKIYNPLFLYGKSGLGKTHLMHAIGNYITENSNRTVLYVTSEQFINDFVNINTKHDKNNIDYLENFKNKYRNIDLLIIDDIQFLGNATKTQQEFFHTFNKLYDDKKQIIISSDTSPEDLKILEERLRTRFSWGLTANIDPPDYKLRFEILSKKINGQGLNDSFPTEVVDYIANNYTSDVRQLEGAITRIIAFATMYGGKKITLDLAVEALNGSINKGSDLNNSIRKIQRVVSEYYKITIDDMKSKRRISSIGIPRQIAMYLSRNILEESFNKIGIEFGGKDHTTVMHSCDKIENEMSKNPELKAIINTLKIQIEDN